jgi:hypothetical protein
MDQRTQNNWWSFFHIGIVQSGMALPWICYVPCELKYRKMPKHSLGLLGCVFCRVRISVNGIVFNLCPGYSIVLFTK